MRCENAADREIETETATESSSRVLKVTKIAKWKLLKVHNKKFYRNASSAYCIGNRVEIEVIQSFSLIAFITTKDIVAIKASIKDAQLLYTYGFLKDFRKLITSFKIFRFSRLFLHVWASRLIMQQNIINLEYTLSPCQTFRALRHPIGPSKIHNFVKNHQILTIYGYFYMFWTINGLCSYYTVIIILYIIVWSILVRSSQFTPHFNLYRESAT